MATASLDPGSFRDRESRVVTKEGDVYRLLSQVADGEWQALRKTTFFSRLIDSDDLIGTEEVPVPIGFDTALGSAPVGALRHERIPFISYPYEWSFSMLRDAALLQLRILREALTEGFSMKDASPYNVQWKGARPCFIDVGSFERLSHGEPWVGYLQFCQLFLYPLLITSHKGIQFQPWLRGSLGGITPETSRRFFGWRDMFRSGVLIDVLLHAKLHRQTANSDVPLRRELRRSGFSPEMILRNVRRLEKIVSRLSWDCSRSEWSHYGSEHSYTENDLNTKRRFVSQAAASRQPQLVWDLGCNTGEMTLLAAEHADYTVACDRDELAVELFYRNLSERSSVSVLPLVLDLANPSPSLGWRSRERAAFMERGSPDLVLCLALLHHLVLTANIPLPEILDWFATLGGALVVEFVHRDDPMVHRLMNNRLDNITDYELSRFEAGLRERFDIRARETLQSGTRTLFFVLNRQ